MPDEKEDIKEYHNDSVLIAQMMAHPGWQRFMARWHKKKERLQEIILRSDADIAVGGISKQGNDITIVVLNKDEDKIKLAFLKLLEREFQGYQDEANKKPEETNE